MQPILQTDRLRLRRFDDPDAAFVLELINEPSWYAGIRDAGVRSEEAARGWLQSRLVEPCWQHGHGFWCVERRADGERLGMCGVFQRDSLPMPDLGYGFLRRHWGQGYAREAARACLDYAQTVLGRDALMAITSPSNAASQQLLRDLDFVAQGAPQDGPDGPTQQWRWQAATPGPVGDAAQLDDLVARFFASFDNRGGRLPTAPALPALFLPDATVQVGEAAPMTVRAFVEPRLALLAARLQDFHEWELEAHTTLDGAQARRHCRYAKQGWLDGQPYAGSGRKQFAFARDAEGRWRIAQLAWQDD